MSENKKLNLNTEEKATNMSPNVIMQKSLPQRPMPARPENIKQVEPNQKNIELAKQVPQIENDKIETQKLKKQKIRKPKKEKKIKEIGQESNLKSNKNFWLRYRLYIIASVIAIVVIGIVLLSVILSIKAKENEPLVMETDSIVNVVAFNNQYYLEAPESEDVFFYIFELTCNENSVLIFSKTNQIDVSEYFNQQAIFNIRYYIQKESDQSRSGASATIVYVPQKQLLTPILRLNEETNKLEWNYVLNASSYTFYYTNGEEILTYEYFPPYDDEDNIGSYMPELDYGVYSISIIANPSSALYYLPSGQSNIIVVNKTKVQLQVASASYSLTNQTIFIDASNLEDNEHNFAIHIGTQTLYFSPTIKQDTYEINVTEHGLNILLGNVVSVVTLGSGEYLLDSEPKICVPQN